ncbi:hypothetical protein [Curtobacterium sp. RRHDQ10]|uniref:hypothetical protein n=1 Tax=Curtobacterium phyllosphaerae TaxID=3413379 RepID=UPI003BEF79A9
MTAPDAEQPDHSADDLGDRVRSVEAQPLEERAAAFAALHDELRTRLERDGGAGA